MITLCLSLLAFYWPWDDAGNVSLTFRGALGIVREGLPAVHDHLVDWGEPADCDTERLRFVGEDQSPNKLACEYLAMPTVCEKNEVAVGDWSCA